MTKEELLSLHKKLAEEAVQIMERKNHDYSKQGCFDNFKVAEAVGICTAAEGILVRMCDKLSRLSTTGKLGAKVNESVKDTVLDLVNYAILYYAIKTEEEAAPKHDDYDPA